MRGWRRLAGVAEARALFLEAVGAARRGLPPAVEELGLDAALGRVLAEAVTSPVDVPHFPRSRVDGFAVRAQDTYGATEALPAYLELAGEVSVSQVFAGSVGPGQAVAVATGSMLPPGSDAVVMLEHAEVLGAGGPPGGAGKGRPAPPGGPGGFVPRAAASGGGGAALGAAPSSVLAVLRPVAVGENCVAVGEDVARGAMVLPRGWRLRPADIAALAAVGRVRVGVWARPRVAVVSTGDELVPAEESPGPGRVRDCNLPALAACVRRDGGIPWGLGVLPDRGPELSAGLAQALEADMVLLSGGSSVGERDLVASALDALGPPGVLVHGVRVRPGKPTVLAVARGCPVVGLPGHPVSALVSYELFARPALLLLAGLEGGTGAEAVPGRPAAAETERAGPAAAAARAGCGVAIPTDEAGLTGSRDGPVPAGTPSGARRPGSGVWPGWAPADWVRARLVERVPSAVGREDYVRVRLEVRDGGLWARPVPGGSALITGLVWADGLARVPEAREGLEAGEEAEVLLCR
ncbi:MAG: molybdopterin molybdotransferase MoeA [Acetobacteraceae bacterium]|nr:molybdopterin molybdotransferase MoeA [Acetobacteraceae bacterium]